MTTVSVIIPVYNSARYLGQAIQSVLAQTYQEFEILVINDGSTDNTAELALSYQDRIRYFEQRNSGPASARNTGLRNAQGKYIAFLDADDIFLPEKLELQVNFLETHPNVGLVYSDGLRYKVDRRGMKKSLPLSQTGELDKTILKQEDYVYALITHNIFPIHACLVKRSCLVDVAGFDETLTACEDWDLWFRVAERTQFAYIDRMVVQYRVTPGSNSSDLRRNYRNMEKVFCKIAQSASFKTASDEIVMEHYYRRGIAALGAGFSDKAKNYFSRSLNYKKKRFLPLIGLLFTSLFGKHAFLFYILKRQVMGMRGSQKI